MVNQGTSKYDCSQAYMQIANFLIFLLGMGMAGYGIYQVVSIDPDSVVASISGWTVQTGINAIMSGFMAVLAGLLGFAGLVMYNKVLIFMYTVMLTVATLTDIAALIMLSAASSATRVIFDEINSVISSEYGSSASNYSIGLTNSVNEYHKAKSCCGWSGAGGANIFLVTPWYRAVNNGTAPGSALTYPDTCCAPMPRGTDRSLCVRASSDGKARKMGYIFAYDCLEKMISSGPTVYLRLSEYLLLLLLQISCLFFAIQLVVRHLTREASHRPTDTKHQQSQQPQKQQQQEQQQKQDSKRKREH